MRHRKSGFVLLATMVAGGLTFVGNSGVASAACTANCAGTGFSNLQVDTQATGAGEPKILASPNGDLFIAAPPGLPGPSDIWRSADDGSTWTKLGLSNVNVNPSGPAVSVDIGGGDTDLAADAAGNLYLVDLWLADSSTAVSHDNGNSWTGVPFGTVPIQDRPWVSADPRPGHSGIAYSVTDQPGVALWLSMAAPLGITTPVSGAIYPVSVPEVLYGPQVAGLPLPTRGIIGAQPPGNIVTGMNGSTYSIYANGSGVGLSVLPPGWPTSGVLPAAQVVTPSGDASQAFPVVAVDNANDNNVYAVWTDGTLGSTGPWNIDYASSSDAGKTWTTPVTLGQGLYPWITAGVPGKVDVAWYSAAPTYTGDPNAAPAATQWNVVYAQNVNAIAAPTSFTSPVVAVSNVKTGVVCTQGTACNGGREFGDFMSITHDASGYALISYVDVPTPGSAVVWFAKQTSGTGIS